MALLIGLDLDSKPTTSSSIKNNPIEDPKVNDKNRKSDAAAISKTRKRTDNVPSQISSVTTHKRRSGVMTMPETPDKLRKTSSLPKADKEPIKPESKIRNSTKKPDLSNRSGDRKPSTNAPNPEIRVETSIKVLDLNDKKRKSDATNTSTIAKKVRKITEDPLSQIPSMTLKKRKSEVTNILKTPDKPRKVTAISKHGKDQSKIRNSPKVLSAVDSSKSSNPSNNSHGPNLSNPPLNPSFKDTAPLPDCSSSQSTDASPRPTAGLDNSSTGQDLSIASKKENPSKAKKRDLSEQIASSSTAVLPFENIVQKSTRVPFTEYRRWDPKNPTADIYYAEYDEHGNIARYVAQKIEWNRPGDRELFQNRIYHNDMLALMDFEAAKQKAKALEIQRKKEEGKGLGGS